ncbi:MAG: PEP-CTERM sorting domain-containing protein, partial [Kiritimatiellia bacterium]|nr:PEP-CTERM sorting domain-containing protein [Kiritimatiellia bacterium]
KLSGGATMNAIRSVLVARSGTTDAHDRFLILTDPGTRLFMDASQFNIGKGGQGMPTVIITNGARYVGSSINSVYLGQGGDGVTFSDNNTNANGRMIITGAGSFAGVGGSLYMGDVAGNETKTAGGFLEINEGGVMSVTGFVRIARGTVTGATWTNVNSYGRIAVSNANSVLDVRGNYLQVGITDGYGDVIVADNAKLIVTNHSLAYIQLGGRSTLTVSDAGVETKRLIAASNSTIRIELGARDHATPYIQMYSNLTLSAGAKLEIAFLDDFDYSGLQINDTVNLFKFTSFSGAFDGWTNGVTTLSSGGYNFEYTEYTDEIYLTVSAIPEPGTLGMIGIGIGLAAVLRRRRR